jgi:hypothetical protein
LNIGSGYIFFDETLQNRFRGFVSAHGISSNVLPDQMEGEDIEAAIELEYKALMGEQREWDGPLCRKVKRRSECVDSGFR